MLDFFSANDKNTRLAFKVLRRFLLLRTELFMWQGFYLLNYRVHDVYIIQQESFFRAVHAQHERSYVIIAKKSILPTPAECIIIERFFWWLT